MGRPWQVFVAPPDEPGRLPIPGSPWHLERRARIPLEHWRLLLEVARSIRPRQAELLASWSTTGSIETDEVRASPEDVQRTLDLLCSVRERLRNDPLLVSNPTKEVPEDYSNDEYCRMLDAASAVFAEALRLNQSFRAWID